jgi:outer membrane lipoprotein-sorting protein
VENGSPSGIMVKLKRSSMGCMTAVVLLAALESPADKGSTARLQAEFVMVRTMTALQDRVTSSGRLMLGGPGLLRWETRKPSRSILVVNGQQGWIHYPELQVTKEFDTGADPVMAILAEHLLAFGVGDFSALRPWYTVKTGGDVTTLVPKSDQIRKLFAQMRITKTREGIVSQVVLVSANGDTTTIRFSSVNLNPRFVKGTFSAPKSGGK